MACGEIYSLHLWGNWIVGTWSDNWFRFNFWWGINEITCVWSRFPAVGVSHIFWFILEIDLISDKQVYFSLNKIAMIRTNLSPLFILGYIVGSSCSAWPVRGGQADIYAELWLVEQLSANHDIRMPSLFLISPHIPPESNEMMAIAWAPCI